MSFSPTTLRISWKSMRAGAQGTCRKRDVSAPRMKPKSIWKSAPSSLIMTLSLWRSPRPRRKDMANQKAEEAPKVRDSLRLPMLSRPRFQRKSITERISLMFVAPGTHSRTATSGQIVWMRWWPRSKVLGSRSRPSRWLRTRESASRRRTISPTIQATCCCFSTSLSCLRSRCWSASLPSGRRMRSPNLHGAVLLCMRVGSSSRRPTASASNIGAQRNGPGKLRSPRVAGLPPARRS
mmetsp:Transcript_22634/g.59824  ORF Transcript_22634/g.59824 Transcript_22634/m.59824 type:complete len:237 (+) Transcript_22634:908-1618(+)